MNEFYFNGKHSIEDMGAYIAGKLNVPTSKEEIENGEVPKRPTGSLTYKTGNYKDLPFNIVLQVNSEAIEGVEDIVNWLTDIKDNRLQLAKQIDTNKCYKVKYATIEDVKEIGGAYRIEVKFVFMPFIYKFEEATINIIANTNNNLTIFGLKAFPHITFSCPSDIATNVIIEAGSKTLVLEGCKGNVVYDSERMTATSDVTGNIMTVGDMLELEHGNIDFKITATGATNAKLIKNEVFLV